MSRSVESTVQHPAEQLLNIIEAAAMSHYDSFFDYDHNMRIADDMRVGRWRAWLGVSSEGRAAAIEGSEPDAAHLAHINVETPGDVTKGDYYEVQNGNRVFWLPLRHPKLEPAPVARYLAISEISALCITLTES